MPPLPDDQHPILAAYLRHDADLFKIAEATGKPIHDVLQALSTAPLRDYIAQATALADEADRRLAAATLRDTIRTTDSPIEKRRAASALGRLVQIARATDRRSAAADHVALRAATAFYRSYRGAAGAPRANGASNRGPRSEHEGGTPSERGAVDPPWWGSESGVPVHDSRSDAQRDSGPDTQPAPEPPPPEPLRGHGHLTPGESVAAFLINLRDVYHHTVPDPMSRVRDNTSMFVRMYALNQRQFQQELAAALPLLERGPWRTEPAHIEGDAAAVRAIFTQDDGRESACIFHLVKAQKHHPATHWFVDGISPHDSS